MIRVNLLKTERKEVEEGPRVPLEASAEKPFKEKTPGKKAGPRTPPGNLIAFLIVAVLGALAFLQKQSLDKERNLLAEAQAEQQRLQPIVEKLDAIEWQKTYLEKKLSLIHELRAQQGTAVHILNELSRNLPDWVWLTEVTLNRTGLQIKGRALSNVLISDYVRNLESCGLYATVGIINTQVRSESNNSFLDFTLSATLVPPVLTEAAAAPAKTAETP